MTVKTYGEFMRALGNIEGAAACIEQADVSTYLYDVCTAFEATIKEELEEDSNENENIARER